MRVRNAVKLIRSPVTGEYYPVNIAGDTPTPEEKERIRQYLLMKEREVPAVQEEIQKNYAPKSGFGALGVGRSGKTSWFKLPARRE